MVIRRCRMLPALPALLMLAPLPGVAADVPPGFRVEILVDGRPACEYPSAGTRYIEALKGKDYAIRIHNPLHVRVAVALSVDGLNSIDARHTAAREARKWVLDPHETVTISGWQTSMREARRFFFTTEERSYAQRLGQPENLGVISAVFFRERVARVIPLGMTGASVPEGKRQEAEVPRSPAAGADTSATARKAPAPQASGLASRPPEEYAATGIGDRTEHRVQQVHLELEDAPAATVDIRYEYRAQLARLGILPHEPGDDVLARRQKARGFTGPFCPDVR